MEFFEIGEYVASKLFIRSGLIFQGDGSGVDHNNIASHFEELSKIIQADSAKDLCERCRTYGVEFFHLLECPADLGEYKDPWMQLVDTRERLSLECSMCKLFESMLWKSDTPHPGPYHIWWVAYGPYRMSGTLGKRRVSYRGLSWKTRRTPGLVAVSGSYHPSRERIFTQQYWTSRNHHGLILPCRQLVDNDREIPRARKVRPDWIDFEAVRSWMSQCQVEHGDFCAGQRVTQEGLRVIDCSANTMIQAPRKCEYAALSYVWGSSTADEEAGVFRPERSPQVVKDAMICTREMGLQYLWVDRYCVPQDNSSLKHQQIRNMHRIYRDASITIMAACSSSASVGLAGIGGKLRPRKVSAKLGDIEFGVVRSRVKGYVEESKWNSRGWTYQEGLLSSRRLVFTNEEVYFQCGGGDGGMCALESLDVALGSAEIRTLNGDEIVFPAWSVGSFSSEVWDRIKEYTARSLSYESDMLDAFAGILEEFVGVDQEMDHLSGILVYKNPQELKGAPTSYAERFASSLLWWTERASNSRNELPYWWTTKAAGRRKGFPSWSWAGSTGVIGGTDVDVRNPDLGISLESSSGEKIEIERFFKTARKIRPHLNPTLHISAPVTPIRLRSESWWAGKKFTEANLESLDNRPLRMKVDVECFNGEREAHCLGIIFGLSQSDVDATLRYHLLVVHDKGGYFERVTTLVLDTFGSGVMAENPVLRERSGFFGLPLPESMAARRRDMANWEKVFQISQHLRVDNRVVILR